MQDSAFPMSGQPPSSNGHANGKAENGRSKWLVYVPKDTDAEYVRGKGIDAQPWDAIDTGKLDRSSVAILFNSANDYQAEHARQIAMVANRWGAKPVRLVGVAGNRLYSLAAVVAKWNAAKIMEEIKAGEDYRPPVKVEDPDDLPEFGNFTVQGTGKDERRIPLSMFNLDNLLKKVGEGWPKRVGDVLFVEAEGFKPRYLRSPAALFAWLDRRAKVSWTKGAAFISQERFFEDRRAEAEAFEAIESLPHFPPADGVYYMHPPVPKSDGSKLERLLDFFSPATPLDRHLIKAKLMTWFWGGPAGGRPIFVIEGPGAPGDAGRGVGKTTLSTMLADELAGGYVDVGQGEPDVEAVKTRLLSSEAGRKRVAVLDNLKSHKFSHGGLEGLITNPHISGRQLYVGEGGRPNHLSWVITVNGGRLSKDLAERSIVIRLARPTYRADWDSSVRAFIRSHRWEIIADIGDALRGTSLLGDSGATTRWAVWERDVLGKFDDVIALQGLLKERQGDSDADDQVRTDVIAFLRERLEERGHDPDTCRVRLPRNVVGDWVDAATRRKRDLDSLVGFVDGLAIPYLRDKKSGKFRGWEWRGPDCQRLQAVDLGDLPPNFEYQPDDLGRSWA